MKVKSIIESAEFDLAEADDGDDIEEQAVILAALLIESGYTPEELDEFWSEAARKAAALARKAKRAVQGTVKRAVTAVRGFRRQKPAQKPKPDMKRTAADLAAVAGKIGWGKPKREPVSRIKLSPEEIARRKAENIRRGI